MAKKIYNYGKAEAARIIRAKKIPPSKPKPTVTKPPKKGK